MKPARAGAAAAMGLLVIACAATALAADTRVAIGSRGRSTGPTEGSTATTSARAGAARQLAPLDCVNGWYDADAHKCHCWGSIPTANPPVLSETFFGPLCSQTCRTWCYGRGMCSNTTVRTCDCDNPADWYGHRCQLAVNPSDDVFPPDFRDGWPIMDAARTQDRVAQFTVQLVEPGTVSFLVVTADSINTGPETVNGRGSAVGGSFHGVPSAATVIAASATPPVAPGAALGFNVVAASTVPVPLHLVTYRGTLGPLQPGTAYTVLIAAADVYSNVQTTVFWLRFTTLPDNAAPVGISGYPSIGAVTHNTFQLSVGYNEQSNVYAVAVPSGSAAPLVSEIRALRAAGSAPPAWAGQVSTPVPSVADPTRSTATIVATNSAPLVPSLATGLRASRVYDVYVLAADVVVPTPHTQVVPLMVTVTTVADTTPPVFAAQQPAVTSVSDSTVTVSAVANEAARFAVAILLAVDPSTGSAPAAPSASAVREGSVSGPAFVTKALNADATNAAGVKISGLRADTAYIAYVVATDTSVASNMQAQATSLSFTSLPDHTPPTFGAGYPTTRATAATADDSVDIVAVINEGGRVHFVVAKTSTMTIPGAAPVTVQQVLAGEVPLPGSASGELATIVAGIIDVSQAIADVGGEVTRHIAPGGGLVASTGYTVYFVAEDDHTPTRNAQVSVRAITFTTVAHIDDIAPAFPAGTPTATSPLSTAVTLTLGSTEAAGYAFIVVRQTAGVSPTAASIRAATPLSGYAALGQGTISQAQAETGAVVTHYVSSGLIGGTSYLVFLTMWDSAGNVLSPPVSVPFISPVETTPPAFMATYPRVTASRTDTATLSAAINEAGVVHFMVVDAAALTAAVNAGMGPTANGITSNTVSQSLLSAGAAFGVLNCPIPGIASSALLSSGLLASTNYVALYVAVDNSVLKNTQTAPTQVSFTMPTPSCSDGYRNGLETGKDCGPGSSGCPLCAVGVACSDASGSQCASHVCATVCVAPSCDDGVQNGEESGIDCGEACGIDCSFGSPCVSALDCATCTCDVPADDGGDGDGSTVCVAAPDGCDQLPLSECVFGALTQHACSDAEAEGCPYGRAVLLAQFNAALSAFELTCAKHVAALVAIARHATFDFTSFLSEADGTAGAAAMTVPQIREACHDIPALAADMAAAFPTCNVGGGDADSANDACDCEGDDAVVLSAASQPHVVFQLAAWWLSGGAADTQAAGDNAASVACANLRNEVTMQGVGVPAETTAVPGQGFYRAAACLTGFADRHSDAGEAELAALTSVYISAWQVYDPGFDTCGAVCSASEYETVPCAPALDLERACGACVSCDAGTEYQSEPCTKSHPGECTALSPDCRKLHGDDYFEAAPPTETSDRVCDECRSTCSDGFWEVNDCEPARDRSCAPCTTQCDEGTTIAAACSATSDIVCTLCSACEASERVYLPCTPQEDTQCLPATCRDGIRTASAGESDVDCGGPTCEACLVGYACTTGADCASGSCIGHPGKCAPPTCDDAVQNGAESDVDCGGAACVACSAGDACATGGDCESSVCNSETLTCNAATCGDGTVNGHETGVDCGGDDCGPCSPGSPCRDATDCDTAICDHGEVGDGNDTTESTAAAPAGVCLPYCGRNTYLCAVADECAGHMDCASGNCGVTSGLCEPCVNGDRVSATDFQVTPSGPSGANGVFPFDSSFEGTCVCYGAGVPTPGSLSNVYYGQGCEYNCRSDLCHDRGMCNNATESANTCECFEPLRFMGPRCAQSTCSNAGGYAIYQTPDTVVCMCPATRAGAKCERAISCVHGTALGGRCQCEAGWSGSTCAAPLQIVQRCLNGGVPVVLAGGVNGCTCRNGFVGTRCQSFPVNNDAVTTSAAGYCHMGTLDDESGACACDPLWSGVACTNFQCVHGARAEVSPGSDLDPNGVPTGDVDVLCACDAGWAGPDCSVHTRGYCGYAGNAVPTASPDGTSVSQVTCDCDVGASGDKCDNVSLMAAGISAANPIVNNLLQASVALVASSGGSGSPTGSAAQPSVAIVFNPGRCLGPDASEAQVADPALVLTRDLPQGSCVPFDVIVEAPAAAASGSGSGAPFAAKLSLQLQEVPRASLSLAHRLRLVSRGGLRDGAGVLVPFSQAEAAVVSCRAAVGGTGYSATTGAGTFGLCYYGRYAFEVSVDGSFNDVAATGDTVAQAGLVTAGQAGLEYTGDINSAPAAHGVTGASATFVAVVTLLATWW